MIKAVFFILAMAGFFVPLALMVAGGALLFAAILRVALRRGGTTTPWVLRLGVLTIALDVAMTVAFFMA